MYVSTVLPLLLMLSAPVVRPIIASDSCCDGLTSQMNQLADRVSSLSNMSSQIRGQFGKVLKHFDFSSTINSRGTSVQVGLQLPNGTDLTSPDHSGTEIFVDPYFSVAVGRETNERVIKFNLPAIFGDENCYESCSAFQKLSAIGPRPFIAEEFSIGMLNAQTFVTRILYVRNISFRASVACVVSIGNQCLRLKE